MTASLTALSEMRAIALRLAPSAGIHPTAIAGISLVRGDCPSAPTPLVYGPRLCIGIQGEKQLALGDEILSYGAGTSFVVSVDLPVTGSVTRATAAKPYLAFMLELDPTEVARVHLDMAVGNDWSHSRQLSTIVPTATSSPTLCRVTPLPTAVTRPMIS